MPLSQKSFARPIECAWSATTQNGGVFPPETLDEVAFVGRSNVGKSSLLNAVMGHKQARTSGTPGATKGAHFYKVDDQCFLVDLPGYGFAKMPKTMAARVARLMSDYIANRRTLKKMYLLVDVRRGIGKADEEMLHTLALAGIPTAVVLTKCDKLRAGTRAHIAAEAVERLGHMKGIAAGRDVLQLSVKTKEGVEELRADIIETVNEG